LTEDRIIHGLVAALLAGIYLWAFRQRMTAARSSLIIVGALLGSWIPDWDLFLGIGFHRSPLTHSALPAVIIGYFSLRKGWVCVSAGLCIGLASHLLLDTVDYGNVIGIPGGDADRLFLFGNSVVLLVAALVVVRKLGYVRNASSVGSEIAEARKELHISDSEMQEALENAAKEAIESFQREQTPQSLTDSFFYKAGI
jgi:hypothetical protein